MGDYQVTQVYLHTHGQSYEELDTFHLLGILELPAVATRPLYPLPVPSPHSVSGFPLTQRPVYTMQTLHTPI